METSKYRQNLNTKIEFNKIAEKYNKYNDFYWENESKIIKIHIDEPFKQTNGKTLNFGSDKSAFKKCG